MKLYEILEDAAIVTGSQKNEINNFFANATNSIVRSLGGTPRLGTSVAKRLTGLILSRGFHIRNVMLGAGKNMHRKLFRHAGKQIAGAFRSTANDHPELNETGITAQAFTDAMIQYIVDNKQEFSQLLSNNAPVS